MPDSPLSTGSGFHLGWTNRAAKAVRPEELYGQDIVAGGNNPLSCCCPLVIYSWGDGNKTLGNCREAFPQLPFARKPPHLGGPVNVDRLPPSNLNRDNPFPRFWPPTAGGGQFGDPVRELDTVRSFPVTAEEFERITGQPPTLQQLEDAEIQLRVNPAMSFAMVRFGFYYALAIDHEGELWGWGRSAFAPSPFGASESLLYSVFGVPYESLSTSDRNVFLTPRLLARGEYVRLENPEWADRRFKDCAAGDGHALFIDENDDLWVCGNNSFGQLGDGTTQSVTHAKKLGTKKYKSVAAANCYSVAVDEDGHLWFWGQEAARNQNVLSPRRVFGWLENMQITDGGTYTRTTTPPLTAMRSEVQFDSPGGPHGVPARGRCVRMATRQGDGGYETVTGPMQRASVEFVDPGNGYTQPPPDFTTVYVLDGTETTKATLTATPRADDIAWDSVRAFPANRISGIGASNDSTLGGICAKTEGGDLYFWAPCSRRFVPSVPGAYARATSLLSGLTTGSAVNDKDWDWIGLRGGNWLIATTAQGSGHPLEAIASVRFRSPTLIATGVSDFAIGSQHFLTNGAGFIKAAGSNEFGQCAPANSSLYASSNSVSSQSGVEYVTEFMPMDGVVGDARGGGATARIAAGLNVSLMVTRAKLPEQPANLLNEARESIDGDRYFGDATLTPAFALSACGANSPTLGVRGVPFMLRTEDGLNWTRHPTIGAYSWDGVAYGNGVFVAVSIQGRTMVSTDGAVWQEAVDAPAFRSVAFGAGLFVAHQDSSSGIWTSEDGVTWTNRTQPASFTSRRVAFGNGIFVVTNSQTLGGSLQVMTSANGIDWSLGGGTPGAHPLVFAGSYFFAIPVTPLAAVSIRRSSDGLSWTNLPVTSLSVATTGPPGGLPFRATRAWSSIAYGNGVYVAVSRHVHRRGRQLSTFDANEVQENNNPANWTDGYVVMTSTDANEWTICNPAVVASETVLRPPSLESVVHDGTRFIAMSSSGGLPALRNAILSPVATSVTTNKRIYTSDDGVTWSSVEHPNVARCGLLCSGGGVTIALPINAPARDVMGLWYYGREESQDFSWDRVFVGGVDTLAAAGGNGVAVACREPLSSDDKPWQA